MKSFFATALLAVLAMAEDKLADVTCAMVAEAEAAGTADAMVTKYELADLAALKAECAKNDARIAKETQEAAEAAAKKAD